jgi:hypothetical protein
VARKAQRELVSTVKVLELSIVQNLEHWCEKHGVPHGQMCESIGLAARTSENVAGAGALGLGRESAL